MERIKLAVIGGGSVNWMPRLMRDVYLLDEVDGGSIYLCDPNLEHAQAIAAMIETFNSMRNKDYKIHVDVDRRRALEGADFVISTFSPGAMDAFFNDLEIPIKYGIRLPVSMTVGPPGISAAIRTAPVAHQIARDMASLCPDAWMLNLTNPMSVTTKAFAEGAPKIKTLGLCHEFHSFGEVIGGAIGLPQPPGMDVLTYLYRYLKEQSVRYTVAGINHFIWLTELERNGEDLIPEVRNFAATHHEIVDENKAHQSGNPFQGTHGVKLMLCRRFGYMPLVGDRHLVEFMPTLCNVRNGYAMQHGVSKTTVDFRRLQKLRQLAEVEQLASGQEKPDWTVSDEPLREIMRAIITGEETETIANTPNVGQLEGLPEGAIVETICTVSKDSIRPHPSGRLPFGIEALVKLHIEVQNLTYEAAMEGSRDKLVQAMTLDPLSAGADFEEIADLTDELIAANREWLPRFA